MNLLKKKLSQKTRLKVDEALDIIAKIEKTGRQTKLVGGCVRDFLMEKEPKDIDIATQATTKEISTIFEQKNQVVLTGVDHGTVTIIGKFGSYEVTTLRKDVSTDGRHAQVEFGDSFTEDALRRDFTINAMYMDQHGEISDFFGGQKDLESQTIRFVGNPEERIQEDHLRIMRLYRFWSQLGFQPEPASLKAATLGAPLLERISRERITTEYWKLLQGQDYRKVLEYLFKQDLWLAILDMNPSITFESLESFQDISMGPLQIHWLLMHNAGGRLRLANKQKRILDALELFADLPKIKCRADGLLFAEKIEKTSQNEEVLEILNFWQHVAKKSYLDKLATIKELIQIETSHGFMRKNKPPFNSRQIADETGLEGRELGDHLRKLRYDYLNS